MPSDEDLQQELEWTYDKQRGDARATAAAGLAIQRAVRSFDSASTKLGTAMMRMTAALVVLTVVSVVMTGILVWLTVKLIR